MKEDQKDKSGCNFSWNEMQLYFEAVDAEIMSQYREDHRRMEIAEEILEELNLYDYTTGEPILGCAFDRKVFLFLIISILSEYDEKKKDSELTMEGMPRTPVKSEMQHKFKSLSVDDIFLVEDLTPETVKFIEQFLEKTNVDLEAEDEMKFAISANQLIYLIRKIIQEYSLFFGKGN